jgi:hypothetical protein
MAAGKDKFPISGGEAAPGSNPVGGLREPSPNPPASAPRLDPAIYVNRAAFNANKPAVLVVSNAIDAELTNDIASAVDGTDGLFKPAFVRDGLFARAQQNDVSVLGDLGLERSASIVILCTVSATSTHQLVSGEDLIKTVVVMRARVFRPNEAFASQGFTETATGVGFSEANSLQAARSEIVKKIAARLRTML